MILLIDNYDSFTFNLQDYFLQLGVDCRVVRNDEVSIAEIERLEPEAIVLSPGPGRPEDAGITMKVIDRFHSNLPMLGICLGHQAIGLHFGASLKKSNRPVHGKSSEILHSGHGVFHGLPQEFQAMRYHSLVLSDLEGTALNVESKTSDGEVMAISHESLPIWGIQFHPESVLTENGLELLRKWIEIAIGKNVSTTMEPTTRFSNFKA